MYISFIACISVEVPSHLGLYAFQTDRPKRAGTSDDKVCMRGDGAAGNGIGTAASTRSAVV